ncbi:MAG: lysylphosphatidylglycerol synthase transmembrane domain-containing protein [Halobacteriota archaeon]|nr:lysylphosphatidylglycerol synthase transmembrane domain-containing protein [Halobacteriota archaeon]
MDTTKRLLIISLSISIVAIIAILIFTIDDETIKSLASIRPEFLIISMLVYLLSLLTWALRIKVISEGIGDHISLRECITILMSSLFAAAITPSKAGGEPVRIILMSRDRMSVGDATAVILGERIFDALVLGLMAPFCVFIFKDLLADNELLNYVFMGAMLAFVVFFGIAGYVMLSVERIKKFLAFIGGILSRFISEERSNHLISWATGEIDNFRDGLLKLVRESKGAVAIAILLTIATWITYFMVASFILIGLNLDPVWVQSIAAQALLNIVVMIPSTPGAVGVTEVTLASLYSIMIDNIALLGVFVLLWRFITYYINLIVGGIVSLKVLRDIDLGNISIGET